MLPLSQLAFGVDDEAPEFLLQHGIPMFFVLIVVEGLIAKLFFAAKVTSGKSEEALSLHYRLNDLIACTESLSTGLAACPSEPHTRTHLSSSQVLGSFQQVSTTALELIGLVLDVGAYTWVYNNCRCMTVDPKVWPYATFIALLLGRPRIPRMIYSRATPTITLCT